MAGVRKSERPGGKFQGWFVDGAGKRRFFTGTHRKDETRRMAERLEDEHRQVRLNYRPAPKSYDKAKARPFAEVAAEYLAWGTAQGGIGGRPWASEHVEKREAGLQWWKTELGLTALGDLDSSLPRVEEALRKLQAEGKANLTIRHRAACLSAFCGWCEQRGLVESHPLKGLVSYPKKAKYNRRAVTPQEVQRLLDACKPARRLTYEVALSSGLRAKELRLLVAGDVEAERGGLRLNPDWTKNRKPGFQPLPSFLVARLAEHAKGKAPDAPLLVVGEHTARDLDRDLAKAGLSKHGPGGKVDFHGLRVAYVTFVVESGANIKEAQALARHSTADLTLNVYARARNERLSELAEAVGRAALPAQDAVAALKTGTDDAPVNVQAENGAKCAISVSHGNAQSYKSSSTGTLTDCGGSAWESNPPVPLAKDATALKTAEITRSHPLPSAAAQPFGQLCSATAKR